MKLKNILFGNDWISPFLKKNRSGFILSIFLGTITISMAGLLMFSSGYVISKSATKPENILMIYVPSSLCTYFWDWTTSDALCRKINFS